jgi:Purple acid Phosphatase, N-terminal domain
VTLPSAATLNGSATDDGIPGPLTITWSKVSGPGSVTFANPQKASTTASFSAAGVYTLRLTAFDGALTTSDDVNVTVNSTSLTISAVAASSITPVGATISWTTNEAGSSQVDYGTTTAYGSSTPLNSSSAVMHAVPFTGLQPNTTYNFRVRSTSPAGSNAVSGNYALTTGAAFAGNMVYIGAEAENSTLGAPAVVVIDSRADAGQYVTSQAANTGTATFAVNIPVSGTYIIWGRVLAPNSNQDSYFVSVDGGAEDIYDDAEGTWSNAFQWTRVNGRDGQAPLTLNPRTFALSSGSHTITFRTRETGSSLDSIIVTNDSHFTPVK